MRSPLRTLLHRAVAGSVFLSLAFGCAGTVYAAPTAPGTAITNTATASYTDSNNQPYTTQSNQVTTTVQNAPSLTVASPAPQTVSPGETVVDSYTLTNTGNAPGNFTLSTANPPTISSGTIAGYTLSLTNSSGTAYNPCTVAAPCTLAQVTADLASTNALVSNTTNPTATLGVVYVVPQTAITTTPSITTTIAATITQPAVGSVAASTSGPQTGTVTDVEHQDARLDINKSATTPTTTTAPIVYSFGINDGGFFGAHDLRSAGALLGLASSGVIAVLDKLPAETTPAFQQSYAIGSGADVLPTGLPAGETATIYLSTNGTTWVSKANAVAGTAYTYVALYLTGGPGGVEVPANPAGSTGSGTGVTNPTYTFSFGATQPPQGTGSGNATLSNIANSIIGGNPGDNGAVPVIAPGVTPGTTDASVTTPGTTYGPTEANITSSPTNANGGPGGASNTVLVGGAVVNSVLNGPVGLPASSGAYDGTSTASQQLDFTAASFACTTGGTGTTPSVNNGTTACTWPTAGVAIPNTLENNGTSSDNFTLAVTPPAGYTVKLYVANNCPTTTATTATLPIAPYGTTGAECTLGNQLTTTTAGGVTTTSAGQAALTLASGASLNYIAVYTPTAGTTTLPFVPITSEIAAYGTNGTAGTPSADSNDTYNTLYPGGVIQLNKTAAIVTNCPAGVTVPAGGICPGGTITYSIAVKNIAPVGQAVAGTGSSAGEPDFAIAGITIKTGTIVTEDGTTANANWFASTYGIDATVAPVYPTGTTPAYLTTGAGSSATLHATGSTTKGPSGVTVTFNNALTAGYTGTITFQVTVVNQ
jgi:hypothetical protein